MQHTTGVAVVATQLAQTDRRALSQAWYSALHLAGRPPATARGRRACPPFAEANSAGAARGNNAPRNSAHAAAAAGRGTARAALARSETGTITERRKPQTELARRIERRLTRRRPPGAAASFAVRGAGGRVHVIVRCDGTRTRVVAVCAAPLRERVERALAQARFALAGCGVRAEAA